MARVLVPLGALSFGGMYATDASLRARTNATVEELVADPPSPGQCVYRVGQVTAQALTLGGIKDDRFAELVDEAPDRVRKEVDALPGRIQESAVAAAERAKDAAESVPGRVTELGSYFYGIVEDKLAELGIVEKKEEPVAEAEAPAELQHKPLPPIVETPEYLENRLYKLRAFERGLKLQGGVLEDVKREKRRIKDKLRE